nr:MAG TPA: hypothetical protein [Caudoviricetes sp.]DAM11321.1 MAG TPA: hypothetical protein [Caudoviricetes sp.]DAP59392.1 MAG TPA: hypothetical protein [Caudoviricetes sp.]
MALERKKITIRQLFLWGRLMVSFFCALRWRFLHLV